MEERSHFLLLDFGFTTPCIHYTMGGLKISERGEVLKVDGAVVPRLYAAGEVTGGVHGGNRLAGNSLLECVVFGRIAGRNAALAAAHTHSNL
jgi:succinate dehydrogenase/fumarate reductase flavoprotein subunit